MNPGCSLDVFVEVEEMVGQVQKAAIDPLGLHLSVAVRFEGALMANPYPDHWVRLIADYPVVPWY
jgi:hypothetical protein